MIILNEVYRVVIINMFIKLLPSKEIYFCGLRLDDVINFITKIIRIAPALIILIYNYFFPINKEFNYILLPYNDHKNLNICDIILFEIQIFSLVICLFLVIFSGYSLKISYRNRLLSLLKSNKKRKRKEK